MGGFLRLFCISFVNRMLIFPKSTVKSVLERRSHGGEISLEIGNRHGLGIDIALDQVAAVFPQLLDLFLLLNALGHYGTDMPRSCAS